MLAVHFALASKETLAIGYGIGPIVRRGTFTITRRSIDALISRPSIHRGNRPDLRPTCGKRAACGEVSGASDATRSRA